MQKQHWRNNAKNSRKCQYGSWRKSETKMRWSLRQGMRTEPYLLHRQWISVILRIRSWSSSFNNKRWHCEMDVTSRPPGCAGQTADAVSANTQLEMEDAPSLLKISECPDIWIRLPRHKWPKSWSSMADPVVPLEWVFLRSFFSRTFVVKAIRKSSSGKRMWKSSKIGSAFSLTERRNLSCVSGRYQNG